ncbi:MAG TPA: hypothetical protein VIL46_12850 [Gemmataceae bacterium]
MAAGGAPEGDFSVLPTLLAELVLLEEGWSAFILGPHTPAAALRDTLGELRPRQVGLSVRHLPDMERFLREYRGFYAAAKAAWAAVAVERAGADRDGPPRDALHHLRRPAWPPGRLRADAAPAAAPPPPRPAPRR